MININTPLDQVDYKIVPIKTIEDDNAWQVLILRGEHKDKHLVFTNIEYSGRKNSLRFLLDVVVNDKLEKASAELENFAFNILNDIIKNGLVNGSVVFDDQDSSN